MLLTRTPANIHVEFDIDTYRLLHFVLGAAAIAFLMVVILMPTQNIYAEKAIEASAPSTASASSEEKKSTPAAQSVSAITDTRMNSDTEQPYFIASPDL